MGGYVSGEWVSADDALRMPYPNYDGPAAYDGYLRIPLTCARCKATANYCVHVS